MTLNEYVRYAYMQSWHSKRYMGSGNLQEVIDSWRYGILENGSGDTND
jgi:hypothetical protein